jgi:ribosomal protein L37E
MLLTVIKCDGCGKMHYGEYGEHGHTIRRILRGVGWVYHPNPPKSFTKLVGPIDLCPICTDEKSVALENVTKDMRCKRCRGDSFGYKQYPDHTEFYCTDCGFQE